MSSLSAVSVRLLIKRIICTFARGSLLPLLKPVFNDTVTVLLYHDVSKEVFAVHLKYLSSRYNLISLKDYADFISGSKSTLPKRSLIITIDDGWRGNYELLEEIKRTRAPVTIFLCALLADTNRKIWNYSLDRTGIDIKLNSELKSLDIITKNEKLLEYNGHFPEKEYTERSLLNIDEIAEMKPHVDFQSHGLFHEVLSMCTENQLKKEVGESARILSKMLGNDIYAFAFPYGRRDRRCVDAVRDAGYTVARTSNIPSLNIMARKPFELRSLGIGDNASLGELRNIEAWAGVRFVLEKIKFFALNRRAKN